MSKRTMLLILVVLSVVVTWYLENTKPLVTDAQKKTVEAELAKDSTFPARPVWWDKGHRLGVGVVADGANRDADAKKVCAIMQKAGIKQSSVEVYDVLRIQNDDTWEQIGGANCQ